MAVLPPDVRGLEDYPTTIPIPGPGWLGDEPGKGMDAVVRDAGMDR